MTSGEDMPVHRAAALGAAFASAVLLTAASKDSPATHGIDLAGIDHTVTPGDDFLAYANGAWIKTTVFSVDKATYGPAEVLIEKTREQVRGLIQGAAKGHPPAGSDAQKVGDYYASYLDEAGIDANGLTPLKDDMARIDAIGDKKALSSGRGAARRAGGGARGAAGGGAGGGFGV